MVKFKVRNKDGSYRLVTSGVDSLNNVLGYVNGSPLIYSFSSFSSVDDKN